MEQYSIAYLHAIASTAGCQLNDVRVDEIAIDATLLRRGPHTHVSHPQLFVQLKSQKDPDFAGDVIKFDLDVRAYNLLRQTDVLVPQILVLLHVPDSPPESWIEWGDTAASLGHRAYWVSIAGHPPTTNEATRRIEVPTSQILDAAELVTLMNRVTRLGVLDG